MGNITISNVWNSICLGTSDTTLDRKATCLESGSLIGNGWYKKPVEEYDMVSTRELLTMCKTW